MLTLFNSGERISIVSLQLHSLLVMFSLSQQQVPVLNDSSIQPEISAIIAVAG
jgi:hypothetical protein